MRYLNSISLALIVLMTLACTATPATPAPTPNIDATVEAAISATKTAEIVVPNLTIDMIRGLLERYYEVNRTTLESGVVCLTDDFSWNGTHMSNRMQEFKKSFDPKKKEWEIQATGRGCDGIESFFIDDNTGDITYGHSDRK